ncbi:MAG TPA: HAD family hydrolase [Candidatus Dojkabacteria bacterium]|nr:HAD family hydrolase [Candidatus Dojkabacteria bacterium]
MKGIYEGIDIVIFDVMGVIITSPSLVKKGIVRKNFLEMFVLNPEFWEFRDFLEKKSLKKGILSNMPKVWGEYFFKKLNLEGEFDPIVLSGEVGMRKPDKEIYLEFEKRSGIPLGKSLFIDDKLGNLKTASNLGVKTVHFSRLKNKRNGGEFRPDYEITSFAELF